MESRKTVAVPSGSKQSMNQFALRITVQNLVGQQEEPDASCCLNTEIWIDGTYLAEPYPVDLPALVQSLHEPGSYDIFTCSCGVGLCAGIVEGIHVAHEGELVHWNFRRPQSTEQIDAALGAWRDVATPVHLTFRRTQMLEAIRSYLDELAMTVGDRPENFDWPVACVSVDRIIQIDPTKPYYSRH